MAKDICSRHAMDKFKALLDSLKGFRIIGERNVQCEDLVDDNEKAEHKQPYLIISD